MGRRVSSYIVCLLIISFSSLSPVYAGNLTALSERYDYSVYTCISTSDESDDNKPEIPVPDDEEDPEEDEEEPECD